jgi:dipeptidyl aminopeptidase/acylaminoacyl peptidase
MKHLVFFAAATLSAFASSVHSAPPPVPELPVEELFQAPAMAGLQFSPDGKRILCLVPHQGRMNLAVIDLEKKSKNLLSSFDDKDANSPFWASNDRILFFADRDGDENFDIYSVNADGSDPAMISPDRSVRLLRRLKDDPTSILVQAAITHGDWFDVAKMNLKTGKLSQPIAKAPGPVSYYVLDHDNQVRFAVLSDPHARVNRVLYRESDRAEWRDVANFAFGHASWRPIAFDADNRTIYVSSDLAQKTAGIFRYDTSAPNINFEKVFTDPTYDVEGVIVDESTNKVIGITFDGDRQRFHWLDAEMAAVHRRLEQSLPDVVHSPVQTSDDGSRIVFYSYSDRDPGVYYLYDRKRQRVEELAVVNPKIDPAQMAAMKPISYNARDGLKLHGYLTLPPGREPKNLPAIIHPHGGPYGPRDEWRYNAEVQFYANRGFAVLQVDFRGSGGYGYWFEEAGFKKWGLEMQNDLTDGVKWLVDQGIADPKRVVISGASYGGYAAMAGLVFTPELYVAGINYVGVVDIRNLIPKAVPASRMYWMHTRLGDLSKAEDRKRIHDTSPVHFADRIRAPLLMAYGRNDPRVTIDQGHDIKRALERAKVPHEFIIEKEEGHGFRNEAKRIAFYKRVDAFLKAHVPSGESR